MFIYLVEEITHDYYTFTDTYAATIHYDVAYEIASRRSKLMDYPIIENDDLAKQMITDEKPFIFIGKWNPETGDYITQY